MSSSSEDCIINSKPSIVVSSKSGISPSTSAARTPPEYTHGGLPATDPGKENRGEFKNILQYLLTCILGNIWRFPSVAFENGGATFLFAYLIVSLTFGLPALYMELVMGQFNQVGGSVAFRNYMPLMQLARGLGWGTAVVAFSVAFYYNVIIALTRVYMTKIVSGTSWEWNRCDNDWNTIYCQSNIQDAYCSDNGHGEIWFNGSCGTLADAVDFVFPNNMTKMSAPEEFFQSKQRHAQDGHDRRVGRVNWKITVGLLLCWCLTALGLIRGVKVLCYISMFNATVPYVIIAILFVRGITLEGAYVGIEYYLFKVDFGRLLGLDIWNAALAQSCFSLSIGTGGLLALSSYNKRTHNPFRDAIIICFADSFISVFGGVAIFSILGFMAQNQNATVPDVVQSGMNLAFVAYPEAMSQMPLPWLWSILFFFMLFLLGISTMFGLIESTLTCFLDSSDWCARHKEATVCGICAVGAACGSIFLWGNGIHFFQVVNTYVGSFALSFIVFMELVLIDYIYGPCRFWRDVRAMMGLPSNLLSRFVGPSGWYLKIAMFTTAPAPSAMVVYHSFQIDPLTYGKVGRTYSYPKWSEYFGWFVAFLPVPVVVVVNLVRYLRSGKGFFALLRQHPEHPAIVYGLEEENEKEKKKKNLNEPSEPTSVTNRM